MSISLPADDQVELRIYDAQGQLLQSNHSVKNGDLINLSQFTPGMYIFKIVYGDMNYIERIIKQ